MENIIIPGTGVGPDSENIPCFRENFIIPGTRSSPDSEIIPYFREILLNRPFKIDPV